MAKRLIAPRLADIVEAIERIDDVVTDVSLAAFELDWQKRWLVERGVEIISEASRHLPDEMKARHSNIPWPKVAGIGNVLRHAYDHIAADVLWKLAKFDLSALDSVCRIELEEAARHEDESRDSGA